jgi:hypothetical protein
MAGAIIWSVSREKLTELETSGMVTVGDGMIDVHFGTGHTPPPGRYKVEFSDEHSITVKMHL